MLVDQISVGEMSVDEITVGAMFLEVMSADEKTR
jgi:hypothetical protein